MNKNIEEIGKYFTEDIQREIREMSGADMNSLLKELEGTPTWFAILKYTQDRVAVVQSSLLILDPIKEAVKIARYQGIVTGLLDTQDAILSLKFQMKKTEDPKYKEEAIKNELGGAYGVH